MQDKYRKLDGETLEQYEYRICSMNEQTGELETWQDVVDVVNEVWGTSLCESTVRKAYNGFKKMLPAYLAKHQDSSQETKELEVIKLEIQKEKQKLYDQRREFNSLARKAARSENLEDRLVDAAESLNVTCPLLNKMPLHINCDGYFEDTDTCEAIVCLSDWHLGMKTENIWNTYNTDICLERVAVLKDVVIRKLKLHKPQKLYIYLGGDLYDGSLRASNRVAQDEVTCDQFMTVCEVVAEFINGISQLVPKTIIVHTYGNHCRVTPDKKESLHYDNFEKVIPFWLKQRFQNREDISVVDSPYHEFTLINCMGYNIGCVHGDLEKNFSDIGVDMNMIFQKYGKKIDYTISADKHHEESLGNYSTVSMMAGSLAGTDNYANGIRKYSEPSQLLVFFNNRGRDAEYNIRVTE